MATLTFNRVAKNIIVGAGDLILGIQELYDKVRDFEHEPANLDMAQIISAGGKEPLGGSVTVGITATLLDGWQVLFTTTSQDTRLGGGNIVALDEFGADQSPLANTNIVTIAASSSATIVQTGSGVLPGDITDIADAVWDEAIADHTSTTAFGGFVQKLLTLAKFLGLK
jgi:hypothetical protein